MIDLCPVGALTSKPFRYSARTWELSRRKSVSPHDSTGANLIVQVKQGQVKRVLPLENESVNECWISDKDRFSYEGLDSAERLTKPMLKQGGEWKEVDWQVALEYVAHGLKNIKHEHGADALAAYGTAHSTVEELALLKKVMHGVGSENIDFRLRQSDFALDGEVTPWLGMPITEISTLQRVFVIGSFLRKDHPLFATRIRAAVKAGGKLSVLHGTDEENLITTANKIIAAPSDWLAALSGVVAAVAKARGVAAPAGFEGVAVSAQADAVAASLLSGEHKAVFLGNAAAAHPQASALHAGAQWIAEQTGAKLGYLTEAANTVGGYLVGATAKNAAPAFSAPKKAYVLLNAEPELDAANPQAAVAALKSAEMVIVMSAFKHGMDYADVLLPVAPFAETSGTFVNAEGRAQSFNGTVKPAGEARPAWKVLRVLGNILGLGGFDYETSESIRDELFEKGVTDLSAKLNNASKKVPVAAAAGAGDKLERLADVPIYFADALARRSGPLLATTDGAAPKARLSVATAEALGIQSGDKVQVSQGSGSAILEAAIDAALPANVVRVAAAHVSTAALGDMFGPITVAKAGEGK
jgi:NADH-quinone oxidoreductase subunit G